MKIAEPPPFRLLVIADLGGRAHRGLEDAASLASRPLVRVDVDSLAAAMTKIAPRVEIGTPVGDGPRDESLAIDFRSPDDFHPDALLQRLDVFRRLRETRALLADPKTFALAAAQLASPGRDAPGSGPASAPVAAADSATTAASESQTGTLERLLGRAPVAAAAASPAGAGIVVGGRSVEAMVRDLIAPHLTIVPDADPDQARYVASVEAAIADRLRALLHDPCFQAVESAWRGVQWLVTQVELGETVELFLLDATRGELAADLGVAVAGPAPGGTAMAGTPAAGAASGTAASRRPSSLRRRLVDASRDAPDAKRWSLLVADLAFGPGDADVALLHALGALAADAGAPLLAGASPSLLAAASVAAAPDPADWAPLADVDEARWRALRRSDVAPWIGLAMPRVLLRSPYGRKTDRIESFDFEELPVRRHEDYLWGNGAFACALLLADTFAVEGWDMDPSDDLDLDDLPSHTFVEGGESSLQPCAEALLGERGGRALSDRGLIPLLSYRDRNAVRVLGFRSIADPPAPLAIDVDRG